MMTMTETSRDDMHGKDIMVQLMFGMLCQLEDKAHPAGLSLSLSSDGSPEVPIAGDIHGKGRRGRSIAEKMTTDGARTTTTMKQGIHR